MMSEKLAEESEVDKLAAISKALEEERARANTYLANWQRAQADYLNFKKRVEQEKEELVQFANAKLILNLLPLIDDFERAFNSLSHHLAQLSWVEGIHLIYRKLLTVLQAQGLTEIEALGKPFDPQYHQAIMYADGEENQVIEVVQKGYKLHNRLLRPALVVVGQGKKEQPQAKEGSPDQGEKQHMNVIQ